MRGTSLGREPRISTIASRSLEGDGQSDQAYTLRDAVHDRAPSLSGFGDGQPTPGRGRDEAAAGRAGLARMREGGRLTEGIDLEGAGIAHGSLSLR